MAGSAWKNDRLYGAVSFLLLVISTEGRNLVLVTSTIPSFLAYDAGSVRILYSFFGLVFCLMQLHEISRKKVTVFDSMKFA